MTLPRTLRARLRALIHTDDPPWRVALALAVGVFISCTPFYFFQTILALVVATVFRLSRTATVAGAWLNLPWFAPFVYAAALHVGALIVPGAAAAPKHVASVLLHSRSSWSWLGVLSLLKGLSLPLLVGTTAVGLAAAGLTYVVALRAISRRRASRRDARRTGRRAA